MTYQDWYRLALREMVTDSNLSNGFQGEYAVARMRSDRNVSSVISIILLSHLPAVTLVIWLVQWRCGLVSIHVGSNYKIGY